MKKQILLFTFFVCSFFSSFSQIVLQESFDGITFEPTGWYKAKIFPTDFPTFGQWERVTEGTNPTVNPKTGAGMARFNSPNAGFGTISELGTSALNFTSGSYRVRFWLYRGGNSTFSNDQLEVYVNTQQNITGGSKLGTIVITTTKNPAESASGWYEYQFDIPASFNTATNYIIFRATGYSGNAVYVDDVVVETYTCSKPASSSVTGIGTTAATVNWTAPSSGSPSGYEWEIRSVGSAGTGATGLAASGTTAAGTLTASTTALTPGTAYNAYVRSTCGAEKSTWTNVVSFVTSCNPFSIPYTENFDGITTGIPSCTLAENINGGNTWTSSLPLWGASYANSGSNALSSNPGGTGATRTANDWFYSAPLQLEAGKCYRLSFAYRTYFWQFIHSLKVRFGTAQAETAMTNADLFNSTNISNDTYTTFNATFTVPSTGTYFIGFHHFGAIGNGPLLVDDINVSESIGVPSGINANPISVNTAQLNWTAPSCGTATGYDWELRTSGAAGSGASGLVNSGSGNVLATNFTGLTEGTNYSFYIRAKNATLTGAWTAATVFQTQCSIRTLPYNENFDGVTAPAKPSCVFTENPTASNPWLNVANSYARSAPNCMRIQYNTPTTNQLDGWFFTPSFGFTAGKSYRLTFWYRAHIVYSTEKLEVKYGQGANAAAMTSSALFFNNAINTAFYKQHVVDFVPSSTGTYNIGFHGFSGPGGNDFIRVDDITVSETPDCDVVREAKAVNIATSTATINWTLPMFGSPSGYAWELRTSGAAGSGAIGLVSSGSAAAGATSQALSGLSASTSYQFYIRSTCGVQNGDWVQVNLKTACVAATIPYTENFDGAAAPQFPNCVIEEDKVDDAKWITFNNNIYARSAPNSMWHNFNPFSPVDDWFFTSPLQLTAGKLYRVSFYYRAESDTYNEALEIKLANFAQASSATGTALYSETNLKSTTYQQKFVDFLVPADGVYYLGFHSFSSYSQGGIYIDDVSVVETITTSVRDLRNNPNALVKQVYPNPVKDKLVMTVSADKDFGRMNAIVRDNSGRVVRTFTLQLNGAANYTVDMKGLASGVYMIETEHEKTGVRSMSKVVKQ
jgi:hypothetical protein